MSKHKNSGTPKKLSILIFPESGYWFAQCIEYNIVAESKKYSTLKDAFARELCAHITAKLSNDEHPFATTPPAPKKYQQMFARAKDAFDQNSAAPILRVARRAIPKNIKVPESLDMRPAFDRLAASA